MNALGSTERVAVANVAIAAFRTALARQQVFTQVLEDSVRSRQEEAAAEQRVQREPVGVDIVVGDSAESEAAGREGTARGIAVNVEA